MIKAGPHPLLMSLLYGPSLADDCKHSLRYLLDIDAAHVLMLRRQSLVTGEVAAALLGINDELRGRLARGDVPFAAAPSHRGLYLLYEHHYIDRLGTMGGAAHLARSRNDINATVTRMRTRDELSVLMDCALEFVQTLMSRAGELSDASMPGFSHQQPSQPSTLGHYLSGVCCEVVRS